MIKYSYNYIFNKSMNIVNDNFLIEIKSNLPVPEFIKELNSLCKNNKSALDINFERQGYKDKRDTWIFYENKKEKYYQHNSSNWKDDVVIIQSDPEKLSFKCVGDNFITNHVALSSFIAMLLNYVNKEIISISIVK